MRFRQWARFRIDTLHFDRAPFGECADSFLDGSYVAKNLSQWLDRQEMEMSAEQSERRLRESEARWPRVVPQYEV